MSLEKIKIYLAVKKTPKISIYELAKKKDLNYGSVRYTVKRLIEAHILLSERKIERGRVVIRLTAESEDKIL